VACRNIFSFAGETKMATVLAGFLSPWPLGWIAATPNGWIYLLFFFFFPAGKVAGEGGGCRRLFAGGGWRAAVVAASGWLWLVD
jgi:hypothetical protein